MNTNYSFKKEIEIKQAYDVIVAGAGASGIAAALAVKRLGLSVAVVERYGSIGGGLTNGNVGPIMGVVSKGTLRDELTNLLSVGFNDIQGKIGRVHNFEKARIALTTLLHNEKIDVYLQSPIVDVLKDNNKVTGVVIGSKTGLYALEAKVVIDASGDGDVSYFAGCEYELSGKGELQPVTLMYSIAGVKEEEGAITCIGEEDNVQYHGERFLDYTERCVQEGKLPANTASVRLYKTNTPGERLVNTTQANHINPFDEKDTFEAEYILRNQIESITSFLQKYVDGYEDCFVTSSAKTLGVRESRRIMGEYVLKVDDLCKGSKFKDVLVHNANFVVDIHNPNGSGQAEGIAEVVKPYDIPFGCFVPKNVDGLVLSGRCISGDHKAHASYRVMTIAMAIGEASGVLAAISILNNKDPRSLDYRLVQEQLIKNGVNLFD